MRFVVYGCALAGSYYLWGCFRLLLCLDFRFVLCDFITGWEVCLILACSLFGGMPALRVCFWVVMFVVLDC